MRVGMTSARASMAAVGRPSNHVRAVSHVARKPRTPAYMTPTATTASPTLSAIRTAANRPGTAMSAMAVATSAAARMGEIARPLSAGFLALGALVGRGAENSGADLRVASAPGSNSYCAVVYGAGPCCAVLYGAVSYGALALGCAERCGVALHWPWLSGAVACRTGARRPVWGQRSAPSATMSSAS